MALKVDINTKDLIKFADRMTEAQKLTNPLIAASLNQVGDQVVSLVTTSLSRQSGLSLEQVRGMMRVKRAKRGDLNYEIVVKQALMDEDARKLEGRRESKDFGKQEPKQMVIIVSKEDELVCMDCEELAAAGPMPFEIAKEHIPKHPHCRCVIMPYTPKGRRLPVTMTTVSGANPNKRMGGKRPLNAEMTLRQIAQEVMSKSVNKIRLGLKLK